jgi:hypothetical protein
VCVCVCVCEKTCFGDCDDLNATCSVIQFSKRQFFV